MNSTRVRLFKYNYHQQQEEEGVKKNYAVFFAILAGILLTLGWLFFFNMSSDSGLEDQLKMMPIIAAQNLQEQEAAMAKEQAEQNTLRRRTTPEPSDEEEPEPTTEEETFQWTPERIQWALEELQDIKRGWKDFPKKARLLNKVGHLLLRPTSPANLVGLSTLLFDFDDADQMLETAEKLSERNVKIYRVGDPPNETDAVVVMEAVKTMAYLAAVVAKRELGLSRGAMDDMPSVLLQQLREHFQRNDGK